MSLWTPVETWDKSEYPDRIETITQAVCQLWLSNTAKVAEIACGGGLVTQQLRGLGFDCTAYDVTSRRVRPEVKGYFEEKSAFDVDYNKYAIVVCAGFLHHLSKANQDKLYSLWRDAKVPFLVLDTYMISSDLPQLRRGTGSSVDKLCNVDTIVSLDDSLELYGYKRITMPVDTSPERSTVVYSLEGGYDE